MKTKKKKIFKPESSIKGTIFFVIMVLLSAIIFLTLPRISIPLAIAFILSLVLKPLIHYMLRLGIGRNMAILILYIGIGIFIFSPIILVIPTIQEEKEKIVIYLQQDFLVDQCKLFITKINERLHLNIQMGAKDEENLNSFIGNVLSKSKWEAANNVPQLIEGVLLTLLFLFFILKDSRKYKFAFLRIVPNMIFEKLYYLLFKFTKQLGDYIMVKIVEATIVGLIVTAGLWIMDAPFALILGLIAGVTNIIPYIGPVLGFIPALLLCLFSHTAGVTIGGVIVLYIVANVIDMVLVFPVLVSRVVDLHPLIVIVSVIIGSHYMGVVGMIISVPIAAIMKFFIEEFYKETYPVMNKYTLEYIEEK